MRSRFDLQLKLLHEKLTEMGTLCEDGIFASMQALSLDAEAAERTRHIEEDIDRAEDEIEALCMKLLLQQQPVARDLRLISAALKMISDMERIGDQAADIAEIACELHEDVREHMPQLHQMAEAAGKMVTDSVESFVRGDLELARQVQEDDDAVDSLFESVKRELILRIVDTPEAGGGCLNLLMIAKYLERIGDHAVNVAQRVEYAVMGSHIRN